MSLRAARKRVREIAAVEQRPISRATVVARGATSASRKRAKYQASTSSPLDTMAADLRATLMADNASAREVPQSPPTETIAVEATDPDPHPSDPLPGRSGKASIAAALLGQSEMLADWLDGCAQSYFDRILRQYTLHDQDNRCAGCSLPTDRLTQCQDCASDWAYCVACIQATHKYLPSHRIREWTGTYYKNTSLRDIGCSLYLGHGGKMCDLGYSRDFTLGDSNGIRTISVRFCRHAGRGSESMQLLDARIFPCSDSRPVTGFTFALLRQYALLASIAKVSAHHFYAVLVSLSNSVSPHEVPNRYREFMRVSRAWSMLQDIRRAGLSRVSRGEHKAGDLAIVCPACPRQGVNFSSTDKEGDDAFVYALVIAYDGGFHLYRKDKAFDSWDRMLSDGRKYFVDDKAYNAYLQQSNVLRSTTTSRDADCNNHRAATAPLVRFAGLDETGVGAVICARHSFFLPLGSVNFKTGERYAYADYAYTSVLSQALKAGVSEVIMLYDIMCHYSVKMWSRYSEPALADQAITRAAFVRLKLGIPKFHAPAHTDGCFARFSLNYMHGAGRVDGEGTERCWSSLNRFGTISSERTPGSRVDLLNQGMGQWNWDKLVTIATSTRERWNEAQKMTAFQKAAWDDFSANLEPHMLTEWSELSTEPYQRNGKWTSVFMMPESPGMSIETQLKLLESEELSSNATQPVGLSSWLTEGIKIEHKQHDLELLVKQGGESPSPSQSREINADREALSKRLEDHRHRAPRYLSSWPPELQASKEPFPQGEPELVPSLLPSRLLHAAANFTAPEDIREPERKLRRTVCLRALQDLRAAMTCFAQVNIDRSKQPAGQRTLTRAKAQEDRLNVRLALARWRYQHSRERLLSLGMTQDDLNMFRLLRDEDLKELKYAIASKQVLGDGYQSLPWYWRTTLNTSSTDVDRSNNTREFLKDEYYASLRVEWFRARERYLRWQEEICWLQREAASIILSFQSQQCRWDSLARTTRSIALSAYAHRQSALSYQLQQHACRVLRGILEVARLIFTSHLNDQHLDT